MTEPVEELKEKVIHTLYVDLNHLDGSELLDELVDKVYQSGVEAERERLLALVPKKKRKHKTNGMRGEQYNDEKMEYGRPGDGYNQAISDFLSTLTNQGETK
jgi:hypothetical protein